LQQSEINQFLKRFFTANECEVTEEGTGYFTVQLTVDMDKELMNRPFYWHYLEKTGGTPNPMKLSFITDPKLAPSDLNGEQIHFGSPRLHQIFRVSQKLGGYIRLYENAVPTTGHIPLHPWIGVNIMISYVCDKKKDEVLSLGLHLISGTMVDGFQEKLEKLALTPKIPDYCFTMSPLIKPQSGLKRIEQYVKGRVEKEKHDWADEARQRLNRDLMLLNHFYEGLEEKPEVYWNEKEALKELYEPHIDIQILNGGIFYLTPNTIWNV